MTQFRTIETSLPRPGKSGRIRRSGRRAHVCQRSPMTRLVIRLWNGTARTTCSVFAIRICCSPFDGANRPRSEVTSVSPPRRPFAHEASDEILVASWLGPRLTALWRAISTGLLPVWVGTRRLPIRVHCRKAVLGVARSGSSLSSLSAPDPQLT
jgi:hypothetical protein